MAQVLLLGSPGIEREDKSLKWPDGIMLSACREVYRCGCGRDVRLAEG